MTQSTQALAATHAHPNVRLYLAIFGALLGLTVLTVLVSYFDWNPAATIVVALLIAATKASLVAAYFMHLKGERLLIFGLLALCGVFVIVLFSLPLVDSQANLGLHRTQRTEVAAGE